MAQPVKVVGIRETLRALKHLEPDLEKQLRRSINKSVREVVQTARGFVPQEAPMSGWRPDSWGNRGWSTQTVTSGIKRTNPYGRTTSGGFWRAVAVANTSAPGMIYELAGSKSDGYSKQGAQFITNIEQTGLRRPLRRLVIRAGIEKGPEAKASIEQALAVAQFVTQRRFHRRAR